ncbi:hypothetical protein MAR_025531 [Mya arenaria]|uniref:FAD-binding domain-containing protein n=1 Tax=Mya arenaria TaxID=6604 RepID=A0ABY7EVZ5_MYAAR|nr:uncharacterized protein LOC128244993 [Mya arenaria]WAR11351.1 hypothetical protein MAR_025531 [Mya arenaria]
MINAGANHTVCALTMRCDAEDLAHYMQASYSHASMHIFITISAVAVFIGTRHVFSKIRNEMAVLTVIIIGAGPIGLTSALIAVQCKRVHRLVIFEEENRLHVENRSYQITIQPSLVSFLRSYGVDFDNLEGIWQDGCFYTRVGIYLEYIIHVLPLYRTKIDIGFGTKFTRDCSDTIDAISGRKLVICCDGRSGLAGQMLGLSDECVYHSTASFGALAAIERNSQTLVPKSEIRVHNIGFDLSAYVSSEFEEDSNSKFTLKIFGNSRCRFLALAVRKSDSKIVKAMKTVLDKSMMRNIFLKCFNTYKQPEEASISDSFCLNHMKFSPRLFEIRLSQKTESTAYISDCDLFVISEGEASRSFNFNTGMDINLGMKGLSSLEPFIDRITVAETEYNIMSSLIYKMEHSDKICREFLKHGLHEYLFL